MNPALALAPILAGLIVLFIGATLLVQRPAPRPLLVGACVVLDVALIGSGLLLLPFALPLGGF
ncbi:hypothetical protein J2X65_001428 [Ancylobacter sp. 3268]|uniref:hypothetical protein n=1 Tax=Ancylobacter sp. 3268 TaxID=2817752 RepID=UPI002867A637|nr:hypothetical protein [Ancylobacter sp. 3268]MDR6952077.1 hypothetical protein [Ancylobacter sp. 3268]